MRNRTTAALLAFFLGAFGGQYFYLGRIGAGIASILFFWTLIPSFIALYHVIKFLTISDEAFNLQYNREYLAALNSSQLTAAMQYVAYQQPAAVSAPVAMTRTTQAPVGAPQASLTDELERLFSLKEKGALTEEEFLVRKAELLA
ncbi:NINE protein [Hymenobacter arizonensis]|uniref:Short C-terminal domain-containing protein n=1 Tax=Hymenobacter arizonensis TaxID=1227077 RepID=A0A1I6BFX1_HYMAR|nr:NINE protein [Hymenobacter arizonensis]SFQ79840.1 Short C-terminal domain-containing protein [Hymenobacter arizonensis]